MEEHAPSTPNGLSRRRFLAGAAGTTASLGFLALSSPSEPQPTQPAAKAVPKPSAPKLLTIAQGSEILSMDPHDDTTDHARNLLLNMFDCLVARDNDAKIVPMLAESWKNVDPKTWEFKLRKGVKFHNGQDFTAADVKYTADRIANKANNLRLRTQMGPLLGGDVVDSHTVRLMFQPNYPLAIAVLERMYIIPAKTFQEQGRDTFVKKPIGTGPFKFVEWIKDNRLVNERNENYWRNHVKIDRLTWRPIPESATRVASLVSGDVQLIYPLDPENVALVARNPNLKAATARGIRQMWIGFNHFEKPLTDVRVRRAIALAIDVDLLARTLMEGKVYRTNGTAGGPAIFGHDPNLKPYPFDPEQSKKLLAQAGFPNGFEIDFISPIGRMPKDAETAQAVAGQLAKIGIRCKVQTMEFGTYRGAFENKQLKGLHIWSSGNVTMDMDQVAFLNWHSKGRGIYYNSPKSDTLIDQGRTTLDVAKRRQIYTELQKVMAEDVAVVPMWEFQNIYGVSNKVLNFVARTDERIYVHDLDMS